MKTLLLEATCANTYDSLSGVLCLYWLHDIVIFAFSSRPLLAGDALIFVPLSFGWSNHWQGFDAAYTPKAHLLTQYLQESMLLQNSRISYHVLFIHLTHWYLGSASLKCAYAPFA